MAQLSIDAMMGFVIGVERVGEVVTVFVYERKERVEGKGEGKEGWAVKRKFNIDGKS